MPRFPTSTRWGAIPFNFPTNVLRRNGNRVIPTVRADDKPYRPPVDQSGFQFVRQDQNPVAVIGVDMRPWPARHVNPVFIGSVASVHIVHDIRSPVLCDT
jgi:hypothetical protein